MMMKVLCQKNHANGLRTAIKTHRTLFVHQRKGKRSFTAPSVPLTLHYAHGGKSDVRRHVGTKNHIDIANVKPNSRSMKTFISSPNMTNSEIDLRKAVTKSETIMCQLIVNLNLPLSTADTFTKCFKQMFTDLKIAKGMT